MKDITLVRCNFFLRIWQKLDKKSRYGTQWILCTYIMHIWLIIPSQSPNNSTSGVRCDKGSRFIKTWGISGDMEDGMRATGRTFKLEPIIISRST